MENERLERDMLIIRKLIDGDVSHMNDIIIALQRDYQKVFDDIRKKDRDTIQELSEIVILSHQKKSFHNTTIIKKLANSVMDNIPYNFAWLVDGMNKRHTTAKVNCDCEHCKKVIKEFGKE